MLQFETNNSSISIMQLFPLMTKMTQGDKSLASATTMMKKLIGDNYEWKIADVDKILNGNFEIEQKGLFGMM